MFPKCAAWIQHSASHKVSARLSQVRGSTTMHADHKNTMCTLKILTIYICSTLGLSSQIAYIDLIPGDVARQGRLQEFGLWYAI